ncbi:sodium-coupled monocarboxylate transporter 1-like [Centruroides vittatus]|uniref:sodium-coupled monocarboxylate transporter 1-like n=1 Tax=Centruroides vittatus TaxID=120091 RepID=UPI0035103268
MSERDHADRFCVADYVVFAFMLAVSAAIGIYYACTGQKQKTTNEFLLGSKNMSIFPVAMSILASFLSAITLLGLPAEMYQYGTLYTMIGISVFLMVPAAAHLYLPVFYNLKLTSAYEYLELRFNKYIRSMASAVFAFQMMIYMAIVLYAPSLALSQVTGIGLWFAVLSTGIVCTFYTTIGGMKAVVWTDLVQVLMMFISMFTVVAKGANDVGGMRQVWETSVNGKRIEFFNFDTDIGQRHTFWNLLVGGYFMWLSTYGVNQAMVQRYLSLPTLKAAQKTVWINLPALTLLLTLCGLSGLVVYTKYHDCDPILTKQVQAPDQLFPLFVMDTLGNFPGLPGLFVSGIFSGALSTVSSGVNSLAAVTLEDFIKAYFKFDLSESKATKITKILALVYGIVAILLVLVAQYMGNVLQATLSIFGMIGGPLLGLFTLGMFFPWSNSTGAATGFISGLAVSFWIGIGVFIYKPYFPKAPVSIQGCSEALLNVTTIMRNTTTVRTNQDIFPLYRVSYVWYSVIGCLWCTIVGLIVSFCTGAKKPEEISCKLLSPAIVDLYKLLPPPIRPKFQQKYLQLRFNRILRSIASTIFSLNMLMYMAIVLYAPSLALSQVTGIGLWFAVLSTGLVCTFYTTIGGLKAVVWTDLFQVIMMYCSMIAVVAKGATDIGGMRHVFKVSADSGRIELFNFDTDVTTRHTVWNLAIGGYFMWVTTYGCNQAMIQRYVALPSLKAAQKTIWINLPGLVLLTSLACLAGLVIYGKYHGCDPMMVKRVSAPDQLFPLFVMEILGDFPGIPGLFVSGVFSGALSTVSSGVNSLAAITLEDLIKTYIKPDLSEISATRLSKILAFLYGIVAILLVLVARQMGNILSAAISIFGMVGGPMLSMFTMGMFFPWINSTGALAGVLAGLGISFWMGIGAFIYKPYFEKLPVSVQDCLPLYLNITSQSNFTQPTRSTINQDIFPLYRVSYMWYSVIGCIVGVIVGILVSFLTGYTKAEDLDVNLLSPVVRDIFSSLPRSVRKKLGMERFKNEIVPGKDLQTEGIHNRAFDSMELSSREKSPNGNVE